MVNQSICGDLKINFGASGVLDSLGSEDRAQRLLPCEDQRPRILGEILQMDLDGPKSYWDLAAFREQHHLT